ncbi:MAG: hypothetical protein KGI08_07505 [Thaumarchaeota archaeon]|nr:hypothetical protein [Nitrososphaerota archaeon]
MTNSQVSVTSAVTEILSYSKDRTAISLFNNGSVTCFISQDQTNLINRGYPLAAGASITIKGDKNTSPQNPVYGQCTTLSTDIRISELYQGEDVVLTSAPPTVAGSQNEFQQLSVGSESGELVTITGSLGATGIIISYTPATSIHFDIFMGEIMSTSSVNPAQAQLRNATIIRETGLVVANSPRHKYIIKGDALLGDGIKTYDINATVWTDALIFGTLEGIIH